MAEPSFVVIYLRQCPHCHVGGERFMLPIPHGGVNHQCSQCGGMICIEARGFSETWNLEDHEERDTQL
jgi:hypothetical protein